MKHGPTWVASKCFWLGGWGMCSCVLNLEYNIRIYCSIK
jgi:hypothetical protein